MDPIGKARPATVADMKFIEAWLPKDATVGTLAMNWNVTVDVFSDGGVSVWEDIESGKPMAYCWGSLNSHSSVLEVRSEYRGKGIGRVLANFMIEKSLAMRDPLLEIQISPETAESFWQGKGFQTYRQHGRCYGRRMLELKRPLEAGVHHLVTGVLTAKRNVGRGKPDGVGTSSAAGS